MDLIEKTRKLIEESTQYTREEKDGFMILYTQFIENKEKSVEVSELCDDVIIKFDDLPEIPPESPPKTLSTIKLNGGLGTTMGCTGPKSLLELRDGKSILQHTVDSCPSLTLMNSFHTHKATLATLKRSVKYLLQHKYPRLDPKTLLPLLDSPYPPGHGNLFQLLGNPTAQYLFISNCDNVAATPDPRIIYLMEEESLDLVVEVVRKDSSDIKGDCIGSTPTNGVILDGEGEYFNTNSLWIRSSALKEIGPLDLIINTKKEGIQLESAIGSAIKYFRRSKCLLVDRRRFQPIKTCADLFRARCHTTDPLNVPEIHLEGEEYSTVERFNKTMKESYYPDITHLRKLTIKGPAHFKKGTVLKGVINIVN